MALALRTMTMRRKNCTPRLGHLNIKFLHRTTACHGTAHNAFKAANHTGHCIPPYLIHAYKIRAHAVYLFSIVHVGAED